MEYLYDDDCWLPVSDNGPTHLSKSLLDAIQRGDAILNGDTLHIKLTYHGERLSNIFGEE